MDMPKRYENMTREERISASDKAFISNLEDSLRRNIRHKHGVDIPKNELSMLIEDALKEWIEAKKKKKK